MDRITRKITLWKIYYLGTDRKPLSSLDHDYDFRTKRAGLSYMRRKLTRNERKTYKLVKLEGGATWIG